MRPPLVNIWVIVAVVAVIRTPVARSATTNIETLIVIRTAIVATVTTLVAMTEMIGTEITMDETAAIGETVEALLPPEAAVAATHPITEGAEATPEVLPEVAALVGEIMRVHPMVPLTAQSLVGEVMVAQQFGVPAFSLSRRWKCAGFIQYLLG